MAATTATNIDIQCLRWWDRIWWHHGSHELTALVALPARIGFTIIAQLDSIIGCESTRLARTGPWPDLAWPRLDRESWRKERFRYGCICPFGRQESEIEMARDIRSKQQRRKRPTVVRNIPQSRQEKYRKRTKSLKSKVKELAQLTDGYIALILCDKSGKYETIRSSNKLYWPPSIKSIIVSIH